MNRQSPSSESSLPSVNLRPAGSVSQVMLKVIYALVPGIAIYVYFFGWGVVINILLAITVALASEAGMLALRQRPIKPFLYDCSAIVTAVLLALALPPLAPWWITLIGTAFAIIIAKQLYGGLGYNPFNPAMIGYVVLLISFPREMTAWLAPELLSGHSLGFIDTVLAIFTGHLPQGISIDTITMATPLDAMKTQVAMGQSVGEVMNKNPIFSSSGSNAVQWINGMFLAGGIWLIYKKIIGWQIPVATLGSLFLIALIFYFVNLDAYPSPLFHLFTGATMLGAFFIATDPVTASTTPHGRLYYGAGIGIFTYIIRTWGGFPDAIAFAVLLMNMAAPMIDYYTQPRVFGHKG